jgi:hypothetical protein
MKTVRMMTRDETFDSQWALESLGGDRLHRNYCPTTSPDMMASLRMSRPEPTDYAAVYALATEQLGPGLATTDEIRRVDEMTGAAIWVVRRHGEVAGFLAPLALTHAGRDALLEGEFDPTNIDRSWVAAMGAPLAGFYCWCYGGRDQVTRGALVLGLKTLIDKHFADLPFFGKDTTEAGARIMRHLGFHSFETTPHLFWRCANLMGPAQ